MTPKKLPLEYTEVEAPVPAAQSVDLSIYEVRRSEIINSTETIYGVFYIYNGEIIPNYYSETIQPKLVDERSKECYHDCFFNSYMRKKYPVLICKRDNSIPRGRVEKGATNAIFIDKCYKDDEAMIEKYANHI